MKPSVGLAEKLLDVLCGGAIMEQHFPMLLRGGIPDVGLTVHSHFLTFLATAGQSLGFSAIAECPVASGGEYARLGDVRADSVWFHREKLEAELAFEFERFERGDEAKLRKKVQNLAIASLATPSLKLAVLIYWVRSGFAPRNMCSVVDNYGRGFRRRGHDVPCAPTALMIIKCVMCPARSGGRLLFGEFLRDGRNECLALGGP